VESVDETPSTSKSRRKKNESQQATLDIPESSELPESINEKSTGSSEEQPPSIEVPVKKLSSRIEKKVIQERPHAQEKVDDDEVRASEDEATLMKAIENNDIVDVKFWQKNDYFQSLLDPDVIEKLDFTKYDLAKLLTEFFGEMFKEDYIDFKVSGIAVHSAAKIYRYKITQVLEQQEKEEEERKKEMLRRNIPSTISQPLRAGRSIATQEDFLNSMRSAIIEVMRKREKQALRLTRQKTGDETADAKKARSRKALPDSIRKALLGKERIEDTLQRWLEIIHEKIKQNPDKTASYFNDLKPMIEKTDRYGYRFEEARLFLSLMFLRNRDKIEVTQEEELTDMVISKV